MLTPPDIQNILELLKRVPLKGIEEAEVAVAIKAKLLAMLQEQDKDEG